MEFCYFNYTNRILAQNVITSTTITEFWFFFSYTYGIPVCKQNSIILKVLCYITLIEFHYINTVLLA